LKRKTEKNLSGLIVATGISSVVSQLLIVREYLTQFQGNEYVIALIFFAWLLLGGCGCALSGMITHRYVKAATGRLAGLSLLAAALPMATLMAIRLLRDTVLTHGASAGFYKTLGFIFLTLGPYGCLVGFILPYSLAVMRSVDPGYPATNVYVLDNLGDCAGGALLSFVLIVLVSPLQAVTFASGLLTLAACNLVLSSGRLSLKKIAAAGLTVVVLAAGLFWEIPSLMPSSGRLAWYRESKYGRITVVQDQGQDTIYADGVPLTSNLDVAAAEAAVHYPMSQTRQPGSVLIISAGGGMLKELAKYQPTAVDYVELDPEIAKAQFRFNILKKISGLRIISRDGRAYLAGTQKRYDAVISNISDPETFQTNRYYTAAFFRLVKAHLNPRGVMSFSIDGYANYVSEPKLRVISTLYQTAKQHFRNVLILPGERIFFICSDGDLDRDIPGRLAARGIRTDYVSGYYYGNVTDERIDGLSRQLIEEIPANTDTAPYLMRLMFSGWFEKFAASPRWLYLGLAVLLALYFTRLSKEEYFLFSTGFMIMGSEVTVIFAFQIFFGYIYSQINLIVTLFLAGMLSGALLGKKSGRHTVNAMRLTDGGLIGMVVLLALIILPENAHPSIWLLLFFGFGISVLCGCQFPLALGSGGEDQRKSARAFTADLVGAACGALMVSTLLIPYLGLSGTLIALTVLKASSLLVTGFNR
jgi:spermidine synthase